MPSPLQNAIDNIQDLVDMYNQGTKGQPKDGSMEWFELRAHTLGLAYLKRIGDLGVAGDSGACERLYRVHLKVAKQTPLPEAQAVLLERLPDGSLPTGSV